jgi:hypothetical protein
LYAVFSSVKDKTAVVTSCRFPGVRCGTAVHPELYVCLRTRTVPSCGCGRLAVQQKDDKIDCNRLGWSLCKKLSVFLTHAWNYSLQLPDPEAVLSQISARLLRAIQNNRNTLPDEKCMRLCDLCAALLPTKLFEDTTLPTSNHLCANQMIRQHGD